MPDSVYAEGRLDQPGEWRVLVRGYDKLVLRPREDATRLYNLADDPGKRTTWRTIGSMNWRGIRCWL